MSIKDACYVLELVEQSPGSNAKLMVLKQNDSPELRFLLESALNPFLNYGVRLDETEKVEAVGEDTASIEVFQKIRQELIDRDISGDEARLAMAHMCADRDPIVDKWLHRVFARSLRAGIAHGMVNKAFSKLLPSFDLALCQAISDEDVAAERLPEGEWYISKKIDGVRCVAFVDENYNVEFYSRGGKPFSNLGVIEEQLKLLAKNSGMAGHVFDGELYSKAGTWNETISVVHADKAERDQKSVLFLIFDTVRFSEWQSQETEDFRSRYVLLEGCFAKADRGQVPNLQLVEHVPVKDFAQAQQLMRKYMEEGFEGTVLKEASASYHFRRSRFWLKWKTINTYDCRIIRVAEGNGKYVGTFGSFELETEDGVRVNCGSGYSDEQRKEFWDKRESLVGLIVEVEAQSKTVDGSLRFPIFKRIRKDM